MSFVTLYVYIKLNLYKHVTIVFNMYYNIKNHISNVIKTAHVEK